MRAPDAWLRETPHVTVFRSDDAAVAWSYPSHDTPLYTKANALRAVAEELPASKGLSNLARNLLNLADELDEVVRPEPPEGSVVRTTNGTFWVRTDNPVNNARWEAYGYVSETWEVLRDAVTDVYRKVE